MRRLLGARGKWKLVFRAGLLLVAAGLYFIAPEWLDFTAPGGRFSGGFSESVEELCFRICRISETGTAQAIFQHSFLLIIWATLAIGMLFRLIPNKFVPIGARKHFRSSFRAANFAKNNAATPCGGCTEETRRAFEKHVESPQSPAEENVEKLRFRICRISENDLKGAGKGRPPLPSFSCDAGTAMAGVLCPYPQAIFQHSPGLIGVAISWGAITAAVIFAAFFFGVLTPGLMLIFALVYSVVDSIFTTFFCPFRAIFMRNRCCVVCRIYNWDYMMMCAPLIVFPGVFSVSLFLLAAAVLLQWEISLRRNPQFFSRETNANLRCEACENKCAR
ncbi:MAG: hypothetical protein FWC70_05805 [Defluviitaleaceae bacterium]|nr:hypothetical protein [Defluviitaleaceae bacterium]